MRRTYYAFRRARTMFVVSLGRMRDVDTLQSYLAAVRGSLGSRQYRHLYIKTGRDVLNDGVFASAWYVSNILFSFGLLGFSHGTVEMTVEDLKSSGWEDSHVVQAGSVLVWDWIRIPGDDKKYHGLIGFYIGNDRAVSMDYQTGVPVEHHATFNNTRKIVHHFWNPDFNSK